MKNDMKWRYCDIYWKKNITICSWQQSNIIMFNAVGDTYGTILLWKKI